MNFVSKFLNLLERDIATHPEHIKSLDPHLINRAKLLVSGIKIDLEAPLSDEDQMKATKPK